MQARKPKTWSRILLAASLITGTLVLTGCETTEGYVQRMNLWRGRSADDVVLTWGPPLARDRLSDGREVWMYRREREEKSGGYMSSQSYTDRRVDYVNGQKVVTKVERNRPYYVPETSRTLRCETRFVIYRGVVDGFTFEGDGCKAEELERGPPPSMGPQAGPPGAPMGPQPPQGPPPRPY